MWRRRRSRSGVGELLRERELLHGAEVGFGVGADVGEAGGIGHVGGLAGVGVGPAFAFLEFGGVVVEELVDGDGWEDEFAGLVSRR